MGKSKRSNPRHRVSNPPQRQKAAPHVERRITREVWVVLLLFLSSVAVYLQVVRHTFINFDDDLYVYQNVVVKKGLTLEGLVWAFTTFHTGNWHPLTWFSHMLDCQFFRLNPGLHHLTNLAFHSANAVLLYVTLRRMTLCVWRSALVAALFALHPLHVESVAWVAERKDVLSTFFFMLTIWAYVFYVEARCFKRHLLVGAALVAGLMAKPMLVTVPFVMLLLDYWPLNRLRITLNAGLGGLWADLWPLVREKLPWFAAASISSCVSYFAQLKGQAVVSIAQVSLWPRIANALTAYVRYLQSTVWPSRLAILYPYHDAALWKVALCGLLLACITSLVVWQAPKHGFLVTGWFWYLGMLVPVIGLVQIGSQARADRYTYLPLIGLFLIAAWGLGGIADKSQSRRAVAATIAASGLLILGVLAHRQVGYWRDNVSLYERTLAIEPDNPTILANLASELTDQQSLDKAIEYYSRALRLAPESSRIHAALGTALAQKGEYETAMRHLTEALRLDPKLSAADHSLGVLLLSRNRLNEAIPFLRDAVTLDGSNAVAHNSLGAALLMTGKIPEAIREFRAALAISPDFIQAQNNLKTAMSANSPPPR